jgi:hypothetical protein
MRLLHALYPQLSVAALLVYLVASGSSHDLSPLNDGEQTVTGAPLLVDTANGDR